MARILAFSFFPANLPPRSGGELRLFSLYEGLSHHHDVTLLTSGELGGPLLTFEHNARFREVRVPKGGEFAEKWAMLSPHAGSGDLSGPCLAATAAVPNALIHAYLELHADADVIIHDSPFTIDYDLFFRHDGKPRIYNSYNVEVDLYRKIHADANSDVIWRLVQSCEEKLVRGADLLTACAQNDLSRFAEIFGASAHAMLVPNGVHGFAAPIVNRSGNRLVFIGSAHHPNQTAAALIRDVLAPAMTGYEFHIIGRCMEPGRPRPNVISHGVVDDAAKRSLFSGALASINPMLEGGGSSLKVPDMAAHGLPLISTDLGTRGYDLVPGRHYGRIDPENALDGVRQALSDPKALRAQAKAAADHFSRNFTWPQIARKFAVEIDRLVTDGGGHPARPRVVALDDYDPFASVGGGCTRTRGLYEGASKQIHPIILTFGEGQEIVRRELFGGRGLGIAIPKTAEHHQRDVAQASEFHVSTVDLIVIEMAAANPLMAAVFKATESFADLVACEHPYMVGLLTGGQRKFIYSSQNHESALKRQLLAYHQRRDELIASIEAMERYSVGCSELVVAVSEGDAAAFSSEYDLVAPVVVVSNGAEDPVFPVAPVPLLPGFNACFLGSGHMPNYQAVKLLIDTVAPALPAVAFHIAGSVCDGFASVPSNVTLHGRLDDAAKTALLLGCQLALNPMEDGSGSNVKVADYLMHGLRVLSTPFGARGYDGLGEDDLQLAALTEFPAAISRLAAEPPTTANRDARQKRFEGRFSMQAFGAQYGAIIAEMVQPRRRALFVTYRYNSPPRGGGEFYVNRLISYLAGSGVSVDVVTPKVDHIEDVNRLTSDYAHVSGAYPVPFGNPRVRVAKFDTQAVPGRDEALQLAWAQQPGFERALYRQFSSSPIVTGLLWGWTDGSSGGRWTMDQFAVQSAKAGKWHLKGSAPAARYLVVRGDDGSHLLDQLVNGNFECDFDAPSGMVQFDVLKAGSERPVDPRPLGLFITDVLHASTSLLEAQVLTPWQKSTAPLALFHALHAAAHETRVAAGASLADNRGPFAPGLEAYLEAHAADYDLIITHNAVFRTTSQAVKVANRAGIPSIVVPHAHFEDDYYHFPDVMDCIQNATRALVTPPVSCTFLKQIGLNNVDFLSPGVDGQEAFTKADESAFQALYGRREPFVLVAGRKSAIKGYRDIIAAVSKLRAGDWPKLRVVMVGPDDDGQAVTEAFVDYLGMVDRNILRGAYRACSVLANMSRSESFGIVLLEAGLASRPVVANADCAAFAELVIDGKNGYLATPANLADRLAHVLSDRSSAKTMGMNGRKMALEYSWDQIGEKFVHYCNEAMSTGRKSGE